MILLFCIYCYLLKSIQLFWKVIKFFSSKIKKLQFNRDSKNHIGYNFSRNHTAIVFTRQTFLLLDPIDTFLFSDLQTDEGIPIPIDKWNFYWHYHIGTFLSNILRNIILSINVFFTILFIFCPSCPFTS